MNSIPNLRYALSLICGAAAMLCFIAMFFFGYLGLGDAHAGAWIDLGVNTFLSMLALAMCAVYTDLAFDLAA